MDTTTQSSFLNKYKYLDPTYRQTEKMLNVRTSWIIRGLLIAIGIVLLYILIHRSNEKVDDGMMNEIKVIDLSVPENFSDEESFDRIKRIKDILELKQELINSTATTLKPTTDNKSKESSEESKLDGFIDLDEINGELIVETTSYHSIEVTSPKIHQMDRTTTGNQEQIIVNIASPVSEASPVYVTATETSNSTAPEMNLDLESQLKNLINCTDKDFEPQLIQRGAYWVHKNYIRASHGHLGCLETVTYTTHSDYTFLDNLISLLERWNAPISIAMHTPGSDFEPTITSIKYLRHCHPKSHLVRRYATFHMYYNNKNIPAVRPAEFVMKQPYECLIKPPFLVEEPIELYKNVNHMLYPVNVGRNIAREAALTHFVLASDIELYPNPGLPKKFLEMIARNDTEFQRDARKVYPLTIFEVDSNTEVPNNKTKLQELLAKGKAIPFHKKICPSCHTIPKANEWMTANETDEYKVFNIGKRNGAFYHWEPIYIGTNSDPGYEERISWEGKSDKMTQGYIFCVLDYEFHILNNGFLVHRPGIKILSKDLKRSQVEDRTNQLIEKIILPELQKVYGTRDGCDV